MTQTCALRLSGRARRVDHERNVIGLCAFRAFFQQRREMRVLFVTTLDKVFITHHTPGCFCIEDNDVSNLRKLMANAENFLELLARVDQDKLRIRMVNDVSDLLRGAGGIKTDSNSTRHDRTDVADGPLRNVSHQDANRSTVLQIERQQSGGKIERLLLEASPRNPVPPIV